MAVACGSSSAVRLEMSTCTSVSSSSTRDACACLESRTVYPAANLGAIVPFLSALKAPDAGPAAATVAVTNSSVEASDTHFMHDLQSHDSWTGVSGHRSRRPQGGFRLLLVVGPPQLRGAVAQRRHLED